MDRKSAHELQKHMLGTYWGLRVGLAVIGIGLPLVVLFAGGVLHHVWLEPSISRYYYTKGLSFLTTRDLFVGGLFAAGACLYLYRGFSTRENVMLNLAGVFALFIALLPTAATSTEASVVSKLHGASAVLFFLCIAYVSLFRARDTLGLLSPAKQQRYAGAYLGTGLAMIASPLAAVVLSFALEPTSGFRTITFWVETFAVWTFAAYWIIKTKEMRETKAEKRALDGELKREVVPAASVKPDAASDGKVRTTNLPNLWPPSTENEAIVPATAADSPSGVSHP
jgi:hypothetical protein